MQLEIGVPVVTVDEANARLKNAILIRCDLHQRRKAKLIGVDEYVMGLWWVRRQEAELEPIRRAAGYNFSRAWEGCTARTDYTGPSATADALRAGTEDG